MNVNGFQALRINDIDVEVIQKNIKNIYLRIYPPNGRIRVSAPAWFKMDRIRLFVISKLGWIKQQQNKLRKQQREVARKFVDRESCFYQGKRYLLKVIEHQAPPRVELKHSCLELFIRPNTNVEKRKTIIQEWYRQQLKDIIPQYIAKYEKIMSVEVREFRIKKMKTRWGTCNLIKKRIWLNLELAKKPLECLEYIVVHEMVHLIESKHNSRFVAHMDKFMSKWRFYKDELNGTTQKLGE